jgi:spore maturation protein CgeB
MKAAAAWRRELAGVPVPDDVQLEASREGQGTLKAGGIYLHSRYRPEEESRRLVDSAGLAMERPVLVLGLGLGYHVRELLARGYEVAAYEPNPAVARLALEGPLADSDFLLAVGDAGEAVQSQAFTELAGRLPQALVHPPSARLAGPAFEAVQRALQSASLTGQRLSIAVVGPMYGGSLPIAGYLAQAFRRLGHRTLLVDNAPAWPLYEHVRETVASRRTQGQLGEIMVNFLSQWTYARVLEFKPDVCIALAQAPVNNAFPVRLAEEGIATAFWFVENWRHMAYWRQIAPLYDCFFHIQPGEFETRLDEVGCRAHAWAPTACDPEVHRPVELTEAERADFACDVSFAGAGYYNRNQMLAGLTDYNLRIWGVGWTARELLPHLQRPDERFDADLFNRIVAGSAINLNLHASTVHPGVAPDSDAVNPRVFEIAAAGGFQLCDPCHGLDALFEPETELPLYRDLPNLRERIDWFLAHEDERRAIAARARARALRDHTYEDRAARMLAFILAHCGSRILRKGVRVERSVGDMAGRVGPDTPLGRWLRTLPEDTPFTQEGLNEHLPTFSEVDNDSQRIFLYLREMRKQAEAIIAAYE